MENNLTDREIWKKYWENYHYEPVPKNMFFQKYLLNQTADSSFIEIGGFPGTNAIFFYKNICKDVTLLDFYIDTDIIHRIETENQVPIHTIHTIEHDFFTYQSERTYDIVFSLGFIEHFENTYDVINRHIKLLSEGGQLLIILPNLRGLNGLIQYLFDRKNLNIHNLKSMDIPLLKQIVADAGLENITVEYTRKPIVWLEPKASILNKIGRILTKCLSYSIKVFPIKCKLLSPYIVISATKPNKKE